MVADNKHVYVTKRFYEKYWKIISCMKYILKNFQKISKTNKRKTLFLSLLLEVLSEIVTAVVVYRLVTTIIRVLYPSITPSVRYYHPTGKQQKLTHYLLPIWLQLIW